MSAEDDEQGYKYAGFNLTPTAFADVAITIAGGSIRRRADLVALVLTHHIDRGGAPITSNVTVVAKKALAILEARGLASSTVAFGMWSLASPGEQAIDPAVSVIEREPAFEYLYAYYLPAYRVAAEFRGAMSWPHKIGMTRADVASRVSSQIGTALPERPKVMVAIAVPDAALAERAVHSLLALRGRRIGDAPGSEWFDVSPEELMEVFAACGLEAKYEEV